MSKLRKLRLGRWTVVAAVYALLLNAALTSALLASIPPLDADPLHQLCLNVAPAADASTDQDHDQAHHRVVPCPFCLSHSADFIAPAAPALPASARVDATPDPVPRATFRVRAVVRDCQPRAPPSIV